MFERLILYFLYPVEGKIASNWLLSHLGMSEIGLYWKVFKVAPTMAN